jgi:probable HAF family extracellular repeat protein
VAAPGTTTQQAEGKLSHVGLFLHYLRRTVAWGINDLDQIVGNYSQTAQFHGFVKKAGTYSTLDDPLAGRDGGTVATGINTSGQIVGYYYVPTASNIEHHGFLYEDGTYTTLDHPSAVSQTFATGINASGQIVGYYASNTGNHGFLYDPNGGAYTTLDDPLATMGTVAYGINASG